MFFWHYRFYALQLLPVHGRFSRLWRWLRVMLGYYDGKDKLIAWHRVELEKLDPMFRLQQDSLRLTDAQAKATEEGVAPFDTKYPSYKDFERAPRSGSLGSATELLKISRRHKQI